MIFVNNNSNNNLDQDSFMDKLDHEVFNKLKDSCINGDPY